jgi:hypothetical protein
VLARQEIRKVKRAEARAPRLIPQGSAELAEDHRFTQKVNGNPGPKSVFICVHPWFVNSWSDFNCGIQDEGVPQCPAM